MNSTLFNAIREGGNMSFTDNDVEVSATKLQVANMSEDSFYNFKQSFFVFLISINDLYKERFGNFIWNDENLIFNGDVFSGSTRSFVQKSFEDFVKYKKTIGDFDIQLPKSCIETFPEFIESLNGRRVGDFVVYKSRTKDLQSHSLVTADKYKNVGGEYLQFDWEYVEWDEKADKPDEWNSVSHYSSWEDIENGVKGAFVKILIKAAVAVKSNKSNSKFYSIKTGKEVKAPNDAKEYSFHVDKGLTHLLKPINDGFGKLDISDRTSSYKIDDLFEVLFDRKPEDSEKSDLVSFVRLLKLMNNEYDNALIQSIFEKFTLLLFGVHEQQISKDLNEDREVKHAAETKFIELCDISSDLMNWAIDCEAEYYTSEFRKEGNRFGKASIKESRLKEEVSEDGSKLFVYSSSKDSDLFKYYFSRELAYGLNGGSAYGLATYAILSDPFGDLAQVGYSDAARKNLYGDNCFEFYIPTSKVFFFEYDDFVKTTLGRNSSPDNFIKIQVEHFKLPLSEEQILEMTPDRENGFSSTAAQAFYRFMSRIYYQDKRGALVTPCAGFVYKGKNDGRTYVGWDGYQLIPNRFTNDLGQTWQDCDRNTPEYKEYIAETDNEREVLDPFDGHKTPRKEAVYRLFQKFSSSDDTSNKLADGVFSDIIIHDDKTVDCKFRSNLPYIDQMKHYVRITNDNHLIKSLNALGYKFGKLDCGIKIGNEAIERFNPDLIQNMNPQMWPESCTQGIKLAGCVVSKETMSHIPTKFGTDYVYIVGCQIDDDYLLSKDTHGNPQKPCWAGSPEVYELLKDKYDFILPEKPAVKEKRQLKNPEAIARAEAKAKEKAEKEAALRQSVENSWDDDVNKALKLTEAMKGKTHIPHLYSGGSTQMRPKEFDNLLSFIEECDNVFSQDNFRISEKIDGSTTLFGYDDEGIFVEKFGTKEIYRLKDSNRDDIMLRVKLFLEKANNPELIDFLKELKESYNMKFVKVQIEMLLAKSSKTDDSSSMQIILVPYKLDKFGPEGGAFIVRVIGDDLQPLPNQEELADAIASIMDTPTFKVKPISDTNINYSPIDLNEYIAETLPTLNVADKEAKKEAYNKAQEKLQNLLTSYFPNGKYGDIYEGLVVTCGNGQMFKMTSATFKELMKQHNERSPIKVDSTDPYGLVVKDYGDKQIILNHIGPDCELVGILVGHFAPFTGPKGHGRMISELRSKGCNKFIIGIPDSSAEFDDDRAMYTVDQRLEICDMYLKQEGLEGKAVKMPRGNILSTSRNLMWDVLEEFGPKSRPVFVVGPDRADIVKNSPDFDTDLATTYPEKIIMSGRGEGNVSGTEVRKLIRNGDIDGIVAMTGYSKEIAQFLVDMREDNLMG